MSGIYIYSNVFELRCDGVCVKIWRHILLFEYSTLWKHRTLCAQRISICLSPIHIHNLAHCMCIRCLPVIGNMHNNAWLTPTSQHNYTSIKHYTLYYIFIYNIHIYIAQRVPLLSFVKLFEAITSSCSSCFFQ